MSEAKKILELIETAHEGNTAKLDEIDARVFCWLNELLFGGMSVEGFFHFEKPPLDGMMLKDIGPRYTRSRDALKAIRPEGWQFEVRIFSRLDSSEEVLKGTAWRGSTRLDSPSFDLNKEELAELHAIIQAIEFERSKDTGKLGKQLNINLPVS